MLSAAALASGRHPEPLGRNAAKKQEGGWITSRRGSPPRASALNLREEISRPPKNKKNKARGEAKENKLKEQDAAEGERRVRRHLPAMALRGEPAAGDGRERP